MKIFNRYCFVIPLSLLFFCQSPKKEGNKPLVDEMDMQSSKDIINFLEKTEYSELEKKLIDAGLIDVADHIPGIYVELKYSTTDNFFSLDVYGDLENCYLQPEVAEMLKSSHEKLKENYPDLTFLIYDGVRPLHVQQFLWDHLAKPDSLKPLYVADPKVGSLHNFGVAVDLTLAYQQSGEPLDMGTEYDFFGYKAYPDKEALMLMEGKLNSSQISNRSILRNVMKHGGFTGIGSEWWHFNAFSRTEAGNKYEMIK